MKKLIGIAIICLAIGAVFALDVSHYAVFVDTNGATARAAYDGRRALRIRNDGSNTVYLSTQAIDSSDLFTLGAWPLQAGQEFNDEDYLYKGVWYASTLTGSTTIYIQEKD